MRSARLAPPGEAGNSAWTARHLAFNFTRMSSKFPGFQPADLPETARVAVIATRFNNDIVDELVNGCLGRLEELGIDGSRVDLHRVPGAFELPVAAKMLARTQR